MIPTTPLIARIRAALEHRERLVLGIAGAPGAGKSTLAAALVERAAAAGIPAALVPMDGFHLADAALARLGRGHRKGAIDTFDAHGYAALLERIRTGAHTVWAPQFDRSAEAAIAGSIAVEPAHRLVVTEGNYLLATEPPWPLVRAQLDAVWFLEVDAVVRRQRLVARHEHFGRAPETARAWVRDVDEPNAAGIVARAAAADLILRDDCRDESAAGVGSAGSAAAGPGTPSTDS